jgi:DNA-binding GntR family transcriptional regulator
MQESWVAMETLKPSTSIADQVYDVVAEEICTGQIAACEHLVQEHLAARLGVSRQPVQQALLRLRLDGLVERTGKRGLRVAPLDMERIRNHYAIRGVLDGLAAREAARCIRADADAKRDLKTRGLEILRRGEAAVAAEDVAEQVRQDAALHQLFYAASGNPLLAKTAEPHWRVLRRAMNETLRQGDLSQEIWRQHAEILDAILAGDSEAAEDLMTAHSLDAADSLRAAYATKTVKPS